jgi:hypothetical protein
LAMTINPYTQDLYGREVDGWYWALLEDGFKDCAVRYRASGNERAASIADRLAETADDVPAQLMQEFQDLWNDMFDYPDGQSPAEVTDEELMDSFACGYSPENATAFVLEFIRRVTGARPQ